MRPSYFNLFGLECWGCKRMRGAADAIGEQQPERTRSRAAAEADASGERAAAAKAGAIGERIWKRTQTGSSSCNRAREQQLIRSGRKRRGAAEADAISGGKQTKISGSSSSAQRAVRHRGRRTRRTRGNRK